MNGDTGADEGFFGDCLNSQLLLSDAVAHEKIQCIFTHGENGLESLWTHAKLAWIF